MTTHRLDVYCQLSYTYSSADDVILYTNKKYKTPFPLQEYISCQAFQAGDYVCLT